VEAAALEQVAQVVPAWVVEVAVAQVVQVVPVVPVVPMEVEVVGNLRPLGPVGGLQQRAAKPLPDRRPTRL